MLTMFFFLRLSSSGSFEEVFAGTLSNMSTQQVLNAQWESARPNLDQPNIDARSEVSA